MLDAYATTATLQPEPAGYTLGGRFLLRRRERLLLLDGAPAELGSRAVEVLLALVEADGALLTKGALLDRVWPGVVVEENNLQVQVSALRRVLGPEGRDWIATVPGRGYRFTGPVAIFADGENAIEPGAAVRQAAGAEPPEAAAEALPLSVMVLPFTGRGGDPAAGGFADCITDGLTTDLARALPPGSSAVIAHATADTYKDQDGTDVRAIRRAQAVRYVVEGSVLLAGDQVRVNAQLAAADTGAHVWAERFDTPWRHGDGVLQTQDQIVGRLARAIRLCMIEVEARRAEQAEREHPDEGTAQDYVLRARTAARSPGLMTRGDVEAACALYARALAREPENADALAGLALLRVQQVVNGCLDEATGQTVREEAQAREACLAEAEEKLVRALTIAPGHFEALKSRAVLLRARGLFADAIVAAEPVLARSPGEPMAHREIGLNLLYLGRPEEAATWFRSADALAPGDPLRWTWLKGLARALIQLGRDGEAVDTLRIAVASNPTYAPSCAFLAAALALAGDDAAARATMAAFRRAEPNTAMDLLARRSAVPFGATDPRYQSSNARVLAGLRRAADLAAA